MVAAGSHLLMEVAEVPVVGLAGTARVLPGTARVRRPLHLSHLQPVGEVDDTAALKLTERGQQE